MCQHIRLSNDVDLPRVGLGTFRSNGPDVAAAVTQALSNHIEHVDTASIYKNELDIQRALAARPVASTFVTSKLSPYEQGTEKAAEACEQILTRLQTASIDLILIHWPGVAKLPLTSPLHAQLRLQTWRVLEDFYSAGRHNNIAVVAYSSLGMGDLLQHPTVMQIATDCQRTSAQVLLRWGLQQGCAVIPKSLNPMHIAEASPRELLSWELNHQQMKTLDGMNDGQKYCWDPTSVL
ncbi:hypothetical protein ABBQ38_013797 [Trebouxia sp. C0009 RCD-2024]